MSGGLVPMETDANTGPALAALNERQQRFVRALVELGCNNTRAAEIAGFGGDREPTPTRSPSAPLIEPSCGNSES